MIDAELVDDLETHTLPPALDTLFTGKSSPPAPAPPTPSPKPEDMPDPLSDPLAWLDRSLDQGFLVGERATAEQMLADGKTASGTRYAILRLRRTAAEDRKRRPRPQREGDAAS